MFKKVIFIYLMIIILFTYTSAEKNKHKKKKDNNKAITEMTKDVVKFIKKKRVNAAYGIFSGTTMNLNNLNRDLLIDKLPELPEKYFTFGFGGHLIEKRFVAGLEFQKSLLRSHSISNNYSSLLTFKYTLVNFGYLIYSGKKIMIYPMIGGGFGHMKLFNSDNTVDSFHDVSNFLNTSEAKRYGFIANFGLGIDYFIQIKKNTKRSKKKGLVIGLRTGYLFSPVLEKWRVNLIKVSDGPKTGLNGFYLKFVIGLEGIVENFIKSYVDKINGKH